MNYQIWTAWEEEELFNHLEENKGYEGLYATRRKYAIEMFLQHARRMPNVKTILNVSRVDSKIRNLARKAHLPLAQFLVEGPCVSQATVFYSIKAQRPKDSTIDVPGPYPSIFGIAECTVDLKEGVFGNLATGNGSKIPKGIGEIWEKLEHNQLVASEREQPQNSDFTRCLREIDDLVSNAIREFGSDTIEFHYYHSTMSDDAMQLTRIIFGDAGPDEMRSRILNVLKYRKVHWSHILSAYIFAAITEWLFLDDWKKEWSQTTWRQKKTEDLLKSGRQSAQSSHIL